MERIELELERVKPSDATKEFEIDRLESGVAFTGPIIYTRTRVVPVSRALLRDQRAIAAFEEGPLTDAYKILRTQILHRMRENRWNVLGVTSPRKREGKTLTAVNLALSLAMDVSQTVLLVDADLRNPNLHRVFGLEGERGLVGHLLDAVPMEEVLVHPGIGRFLLLPGGRAVHGSVELLSSPRMLALVKELKHRYVSRLILFDLPPVLCAADTLAFLPHLDAVLLVVEAGRTQAEDVEHALHLLKGTPVIGTVLNKG